MNKRTLTGEPSRKRGKKNRAKSGQSARIQKPTNTDSSAVDRMRPTADQVAERQESEFEKAKRRQLAKAALELDDVDNAILEQKLRHPAITQGEIADLLGFTRGTINERMNAPKFKRALAMANESALAIYQSNQARAARKLGALISSKDDRVAVRACMAHLWPFIHKGKDGTDGQNEFVKLVTEAWERSEAAKASAESSGTTNPVAPDTAVG